MITIESNKYIIENDFIRRELLFIPDAGLMTNSFYNKVTRREYQHNITPGMEFCFRANGVKIKGFQKPEVHAVDGNVVENENTLEVLDVKGIELEDGAERLEVLLKIVEQDMEVKCCYEIQNDSAMLSKWIEITGAEDLNLTSMFFELHNSYPGDLADIDFYSTKDVGAKPKEFVTDISEDIIQAHNPLMDEGLFLCNDAPGPLNFFLVYPCWPDKPISAGYNFDTVPFSKNIKAGETFVSHKAYNYFYKGAQNATEVRNGLRDALRGALCPYIDDKFMYCTWFPFMKNINAALVKELAQEAADLGYTSFVLDDGWFVDGEWEVDKDKFPDGLEDISQFVRNAGMAFGLWFNIGMSYGDEAGCPEHAATDVSGEPKQAFDGDIDVKCFASGHRDRMLEKLTQLAKDYNVGYFKLDFSNIISPYGYLPIGCKSEDHEYHKDGNDSVLEQYAAMKYMRDELKKRFPELIVDFSFEAFGTELPKISSLQFSELHDITNLNTAPKPYNFEAFNIRNVFYRFALVLPIERLLSSLICIQGERAVENMATSLMGAPLMAGDLRLLEDDQKNDIKAIMASISDLSGSGLLKNFKPLRGDKLINRKDWDGFARYNNGGSGYMCIFQNDSSADKVNFALEDITRLGEVKFKDILSGKIVKTCLAEELKQGIELDWSTDSSFMILEF